MAACTYNVYRFFHILFLIISLMCICYGKPFRKRKMDLSALRESLHTKNNDFFLLNNQLNHRTKRDECGSEDDDWEPKTFAERISKHYIDSPEYLILGTVLRLRDGKNTARPYSGRGHYVAEVLVECVYKGYAFDKAMNISGFGPTDDCVDTQVDVGGSYIFLLEKLWFGYAIAEVNDQVGARPATRKAKGHVSSMYKCHLPYQTTTVEPSSSESSSNQGYSQYSLSMKPSSESTSESASMSLDDSHEYCFTSHSSSSVSFVSHSYYDYDRDDDLDVNIKKNPDYWNDLDEPRVEVPSRDFRLILSVSGLGLFIFVVVIGIAVGSRKTIWDTVNGSNRGNTKKKTKNNVDLKQELIF